MTRLDRVSESQSRALRDAPYTEAHRSSYTLKMQRLAAPDTLRELVHDLRKAYQDEVPSRIHSRETDGGGDPAWSPEFTRYLTASDFSVDRFDKSTDSEVYLTPFRACLSGMDRSADETTRKRARIVARVTIGNFGPVESAIGVGVPDWCAKVVAHDALVVFWKRLSDIRLDLRKTETAA